MIVLAHIHHLLQQLLPICLADSRFRVRKSLNSSKLSFFDINHRTIETRVDDLQVILTFRRVLHPKIRRLSLFLLFLREFWNLSTVMGFFTNGVCNKSVKILVRSALSSELFEVPKESRLITSFRDSWKCMFLEIWI